MLIIDAHCHYGTGDGLVGPWDTRASLKKYLQWANEYHINRTVLFAPFHSNYEIANKEVWELVRQSPSRFYGFAFIHPINDKGRIFRMVQKAVKHYGFKGLKVHRHDGLISREICETAQAFGLPVLYDVMGKVETVELIATEYPKVNFIIPHLSSFADDWKAQLAFIPLLERHRNIYTDTSGIRRFDLLEMAVKRAGAHKILFGSDGPWLHPGVELEKIYALNLPAKKQRMILSGNFLRLIKNVRKKALKSPKSFSAGRRNLNREFNDPWIKEGLLQL